MIDIWLFFINMSESSKFHLNLTRITGASHEDLCTVMIICRSALLRKISVSDKIYRENQNTHFTFNNFFSFEKRTMNEIMWKK